MTTRLSIQMYCSTRYRQISSLVTDLLRTKRIVASFRFQIKPKFSRTRQKYKIEPVRVFVFRIGDKIADFTASETKRR